MGVRGLILEVFDADTLESLGEVDAGEGPTHVRAGPEPLLRNGHSRRRRLYLQHQPGAGAARPRTSTRLALRIAIDPGAMSCG